MQASTTRQLPQPGAFGHYTRCSRIPPLCAQAPGASAAAALLPAPPSLAAAELDAPQSEQVDSSLSGFSMLQPTYESVHLPAAYDAQQAADAAMQASAPRSCNIGSHTQMLSPQTICTS